MSEWKSPRSEGFPTPPFITPQEPKSGMVKQIIGGFISIWIIVSLAVFVVAAILDADVTWQESGLLGLVYIFFRTWDKVTFGRFPK